MNGFFQKFRRQKAQEIDRKQSKHMDFPDRIRTLVRLADQADPLRQIFGAKTHRYRFHPPADIQDVVLFAWKYGIHLPEPFVRYLTEVGNGGAGVDYGIYSLESIESEFADYLPATPGKTLFDYDDVAERWASLCRQRDAAYASDLSDEELDAAIDAIMREITRGMLVIGTAGCTYDYVLMCEGRECGNICEIDWNLIAEYPPIVYHLSFEAWICSYFEKIVRGDVLDRGTFKYVQMYQKDIKEE